MGLVQTFYGSIKRSDLPAGSLASKKPITLEMMTQINKPIRASFWLFLRWISGDLRLKSKRFLFVRLGFWGTGSLPGKMLFLEVFVYKS